MICLTFLFINLWQWQNNLTCDNNPIDQIWHAFLQRNVWSCKSSKKMYKIKSLCCIFYTKYKITLKMVLSITVNWNGHNKGY